MDNFWNNDLKWRLQKKFDHSLRLWFGNDHIQKVLIPNSVLTPHSRLWLAEISHRPKPSFLEFYKLQNRNKNRKYFKCSIRTPEKAKKKCIMHAGMQEIGLAKSTNFEVLKHRFLWRNEGDLWPVSELTGLKMHFMHKYACMPIIIIIYGRHKLCTMLYGFESKNTFKLKVFIFIVFSTFHHPNCKSFIAFHQLISY